MRIRYTCRVDGDVEGGGGTSIQRLRRKAIFNLVYVYTIHIIIY